MALRSRRGNPWNTRRALRCVPRVTMLAILRLRRPHRRKKLMLLTIATTHRPATDLGYLLHKNPARAQTFELAFGKAHVFYAEATEERCEAALLLDVDPVGLVRGGGGRGLLADYVTDRPYVASSFMSVAIARVFGSALGGRSKDRPELAATPLPLEATVAALPCRGGEAVVRRLFEPLGYCVRVDASADDGGAEPRRYRNLSLEAKLPLADLLAHLYVLIPVLDNDKHYWVGDGEVEKLIARGGDWLAKHPEREFITRRYLKRRPTLTAEALRRLGDESEGDDADSSGVETAPATAGKDREQALERPARLNDLRLAAVVGALRDADAVTVLDLGCGEGRLIKALLPVRQFQRIVGVDAAVRTLEIAVRRLKLARLPAAEQDRVELLHGALTYRDRRLQGFDAAAVVEVIEHLPPARLRAFEQALFRFARPKTVVVTTPNREYNVLFPALEAGRLRHPDHRFEWTRAEFADWAGRVAEAWGYAVAFHTVGEVHAEHGAPTQMAVFQRCG